MQTKSALLFPPQNLSSCLFGAIVRDTRDADLSADERYNHFPSSPLVSVTYVIEGSLHIMQTGSDLEAARNIPAAPRLSVIEPTKHPISSWSPEKVAVVSVGFYPDAWLKLENLGVAQEVIRAIEKSFRGLKQDDDFELAWSEYTNIINSIWQEVRTAGGLADWAGSMRLADWSHSIMARVALATPGRSVRSFERKLRRWSQQSRQSLKFFSDFENLHRLATHQKNASLAQLASDAGYSDQSHMGRAVRRATGFSPAQLNRLVETEEAFWCYRLLGERF